MANENTKEIQRKVRTRAKSSGGGQRRPRGRKGTSVARSPSNGPFKPAIALRRIKDLKPWSRNARTHSDRQIAKIAASIREFGFVNPILVDAKRRIIAGHGRVEAAKQLDLTTVPTIQIDHLTDDQIRAYVIADNRLAELAGWDNEILAIELQHLSSVEIDFDVEITGFETSEIDLLIETAGSIESPDPADAVPDLDEHDPPVSRSGDLWRLGDHRLLCADARAPATYERLMAGAEARMVFTDPPYNVPVDGHVCGLGATRHREFAMASGEMTEAQFTEFLKTVLGHLATHSTDGALHFVCMDWRHAFELLSAARDIYSEMKNLCVWAKTNAGMGSLYRSQHELVFVFKNGLGQHINNVELGKHGRYRTNVWQHAGTNTFGAERNSALAMHPTVKPVALVADAIKDCTRRGDIMLDAFVGSGTTLIAAEKTARLCYGIEIDPRYVDTAIRRWEHYTGESAVHAETGLSFADLAEARRNETPRTDRPVRVRTRARAAGGAR